MTSKLLPIYKILNLFNINLRSVMRQTTFSYAYELAIAKNIYRHSVIVPVSENWTGSLFSPLCTSSAVDTLEELGITRYYIYFDWKKFVDLRLQEIEGEIPVIWQKDLELQILFRNKSDALLFRLTY